MYAHRRGAKYLTMLLHNIILKREDIMLQLKNIVKDQSYTARANTMHFTQATA